jgi:hypothetical protein
MNKDNRIIQVFTRVNNKLLTEKYTYLICTRAKTSKKKSKTFLVKVEGKQKEYLSSLYPTTTPNTYNLDFKGVKYSLWLGQETATLKARNL